MPDPIKESAHQLYKLIESRPELVIDLIALALLQKSSGVLTKEIGPIASIAVRRVAVGFTVVRLCANGLVSDVSDAIDAVRKVMIKSGRSTVSGDIT